METLFYKDVGQGKPIVLLHGFLETHQIWDHFTEQLSKEFRVISFDLPGFGKSALPLKTPFSLSEIASRVISCLQELTNEKVSLIGHSLGGYVTLAMIEQEPERFSSFGLFHSTALADSMEKKESRTKTIEFVNRTGALAFTSNFIPPLFANPEHESVSFVRKIAIQTSQQTVVAYLEAMRERPDRTKVLQSFNGPILFLAGAKDAVIPHESLKVQAEMAKMGILKVFEGVGHMGMFEASEETLKCLTTFLRENN
jgi:pimeloyl-ACP methyl ester carboxylesterase